MPTQAEVAAFALDDDPQNPAARTAGIDFEIEAAPVAMSAWSGRADPHGGEAGRREARTCGRHRDGTLQAAGPAHGWGQNPLRGWWLQSQVTAGVQPGWLPHSAAHTLMRMEAHVNGRLRIRMALFLEENEGLVEGGAWGRMTVRQTLPPPIPCFVSSTLPRTCAVDDAFECDGLEQRHHPWVA